MSTGTTGGGTTPSWVQQVLGQSPPTAAATPSLSGRAQDAAHGLASLIGFGDLVPDSAGQTTTGAAIAALGGDAPGSTFRSALTLVGGLAIGAELLLGFGLLVFLVWLVRKGAMEIFG